METYKGSVAIGREGEKTPDEEERETQYNGCSLF